MPIRKCLPEGSHEDSHPRADHGVLGESRSPLEFFSCDVGAADSSVSENGVVRDSVVMKKQVDELLFRVHVQRSPDFFVIYLIVSEIDFDRVHMLKQLGKPRTDFIVAEVCPASEEVGERRDVLNLIITEIDFAE